MKLVLRIALPLLLLLCGGLIARVEVLNQRSSDAIGRKEGSRVMVGRAAPIAYEREFREQRGIAADLRLDPATRAHRDCYLQERWQESLPKRRLVAAIGDVLWILFLGPLVAVGSLVLAMLEKGWWRSAAVVVGSAGIAGLITVSMRYYPFID